jgi:hypothetical protein
MILFGRIIIGAGVEVSSEEGILGDDGPPVDRWVPNVIDLFLYIFFSKDPDLCRRLGGRFRARLISRSSRFIASISSWLVGLFSPDDFFAGHLLEAVSIRLCHLLSKLMERLAFLVVRPREVELDRSEIVDIAALLAPTTEPSALF